MAKFRIDPYTKVNQLIIDGIIFATSFAVAYAIRFEGVPPWPYLKQFLLWLPYLLAARLFVNWMMGIYKFIWRYVSLHDAIAIARSLAVVTALLISFRLLYPSSAILASRFHIPLSVIVLEYFLSLEVCLGARALRRVLFQRQMNSAASSPEATRILLVGAGQAGAHLAKEIAANGQIELVGFLDDDPKKVGAVINGVRVLGPTSLLPFVVNERRVKQVVIAIASPSRTTLKRLWALSEHLHVAMKIIPTLEEILHGKLNISAFRNVQMAELLGRETVELPAFAAEVQAAYQGKRIMITGAGGSIGTELVRQLRPLQPAELIILDKDENGLNDVCGHLTSNGEGPKVHPVVADIRFRERLQSIFSEFRPEVVFHAAAHKHVPLMELNPCEAVLNNVIGTRNLVEVSQSSDVSCFVFISTDKAVKPTSIMGATKRVCELVIQAHSNNGHQTRFACVRFGNVIGSRGSVIPYFQQQIERGGPLTITHLDMKRYMMTIPEAVRLVIQAGIMGSGGEIFILDMGDPVPILNLANDLIELSGLRPGKDIQVEVTQPRPGEKLTEELFDSEIETTSPTSFENISMVRPKDLCLDTFKEKLAALECAANRNSPQEVQRILPELYVCFEPKKALTVDRE